MSDTNRRAPSRTRPARTRMIGTAGTRRVVLLIALIPVSIGGRLTYPDTDRELMWLTIGALVLIAAFVIPDRPLPPLLRLLPALLSLTVIAVGLVTLASSLSRTFESPIILGGALAVGALALIGGRAGWIGWLATLGAIVVLFAAYAVLLARKDTGIDVVVFQHDGVARLLDGGNPWSMTYPNVYAYSPARSHAFYGAGALSADLARTTFGFPYPPVMLLAVVPGYLLGDIRLTHLIALAVTAVLLRAVARDHSARWLAPLVLMLPATPAMMVNGWTEPVMVALLAGLVLALSRRRPWSGAGAFLLGALLVAKQYNVVTLPLLWLLRDHLRQRAFLLSALAAAVLLTIPALLWDPSAFWNSVVTLQFLQPYRADATSLLVWSVTHFGWPPPSVYGVLPLAAGFVTAVILAFRAPRTPAGYAASLSLTLMVTVLLSKQAFTNYFFLITAAVVVAAVAWPAVPDSDEKVTGHKVTGHNLGATSSDVLFRG